MRRVRHTSGQLHPLSHRPVYVYTNTHGQRQGYPTNKTHVYILVTDHLVRGVSLFIWSKSEQDHSAFGEDKQWLLSILSILVYPVRKFCNNAGDEYD